MISCWLDPKSTTSKWLYLLDKQFGWLEESHDMDITILFLQWQLEDKHELRYTAISANHWRLTTPKSPAISTTIPDQLVWQGALTMLVMSSSSPKRLRFMGMGWMGLSSVHFRILGSASRWFHACWSHTHRHMTLWFREVVSDFDHVDPYNVCSALSWYFCSKSWPALYILTAWIQLSWPSAWGWL